MKKKEKGVRFIIRAAAAAPTQCAQNPAAVVDKRGRRQLNPCGPVRSLAGTPSVFRGYSEAGVRDDASIAIGCGGKPCRERSWIASNNAAKSCA